MKTDGNESKAWPDEVGYVIPPKRRLSFNGRRGVDIPEGSKYCENLKSKPVTCS
jgi:hypothetical protein